MKILIITSEFPPNVGGIGNHGYNVALNLARKGHQVTVIADSLVQPKTVLKDFEDLQPFEIEWIPRYKFPIWTYIKRILLAWRFAKYHEVILCSGKFSLWTGGFIHFLKRKKSIFAVVHGSELDLKNKWLKKLTDWSLSKMKEIISVSNYTAQYLPKHILENIPISIVPNGITCDEFSEALKEEKKKLLGNPSIITLGNVSQRKGQMNVINALPLLLKKFPQIHYHIVGKPSEKLKMETKAKQLGVQEHITFHGMVSRNELMELLHGSDIKAMLSNHTESGDFEGFGIAVLEANIFGVPAIGSKNSGIADAIDQAKTGFLIEPHDAEALEIAIQNIMDHYPTLSDASKIWANNHDWSILIQQYESVAERTASKDKESMQ